MKTHYPSEKFEVGAFYRVEVALNVMLEGDGNIGEVVRINRPGGPYPIDMDFFHSKNCPMLHKEIKEQVTREENPEYFL